METNTVEIMELKEKYLRHTVDVQGIIMSEIDNIPRSDFHSADAWQNSPVSYTHLTLPTILRV